MVEGRIRGGREDGRSKLCRQKINTKLNQLEGRSHEQGGQRRARSIVRGGSRGRLSGDTGLVASFILGLHTKYTSLGETVALEDGELLEPFAGERYGTAWDGAKVGQVERYGFGRSVEHGSDGGTREMLPTLYLTMF